MTYLTKSRATQSWSEFKAGVDEASLVYYYITRNFDVASEKQNRPLEANQLPLTSVDRGEENQQETRAPGSQHTTAP